ncbi:MAG: transcriptional repressor LexA [Verrucomicrobia bacterium]|nr:transcriptional repressor LexA [Verrucomicrobiota bacterium]MDA1066761.1 transcriptional repressor LexA [Verrucomicrobiota bacterium]
MDDLTLRQQEILGFLQIFSQEKGFWPSIREIRDHFGFNSTNAVVGHLRALEHKGYITRIPGQARTYRITYETSEQAPKDSLEVIDMPVYGNIAAGYPDGIEQGDAIDRIQVDINTAGIRRSRRSFALKVRGESMIDAGIYDGDMVIIEPALPNDGDIVAALIDGATTLKRFIKPNNAPPYLKAENVNYPNLHPVSELVIQGIARSIVRKL